jgi:hypothetical protein
VPFELAEVSDDCGSADDDVKWKVNAEREGRAGSEGDLSE